MKKMKVENVSSLKLDFFLKQDKRDVRIVLFPGDSSWCDEGSATRSMILYRKKRLIKVYSDTGIEVPELPETIETPKLHTGIPLLLTPPEINPDIEIEEESNEEYESEDEGENEIESSDLTLLEKAKQETEEYKKESEKTYKGKKRGRKKKRGPKPGSKKNKNINSLPTISENNSEGEATGNTDVYFSD